MSTRQKTDPKLPQMAIIAEKALKEAVAEVIEDHHLRGDPIAIWRDGKVVLVPADQISVRETRADYSASSNSKKGK